MGTTINPSFSRTYHRSKSGYSVFRRFFNYCKNEQHNRLLWLGIALATHGCVLTPITVMAVLLAGANLYMLVTALVAMGLALVTNLAAMPTKVTIPVFLLSIIIDIVLIIASLYMGMDITKTYI